MHPLNIVKRKETISLKRNLLSTLHLYLIHTAPIMKLTIKFKWKAQPIASSECSYMLIRTQSREGCYITARSMKKLKTRS